MDAIELPGTIYFEPENWTKKHAAQSSWKKIALIMIEGDVCPYYAWFIKRRYNLELNKPLRNAHVTLINDSIKDLSLNGKRTIEEVDELWETLKTKWNKKTVNVLLDLSPRTDDLHWWLNVKDESRIELQSIRDEIGLGKPFWGMHMSIGYANERNIQHSEYIHRTIKRFEL